MAFDSLNDLAAKLPELKAEHERLGKLIEALEAFASPDSNRASTSTPQSPRFHGSQQSSHDAITRINPDQFFGMSTPQATKAFLNLVGRGSPQGPRDIARALVRGGIGGDEETVYINVGSALKRLRKAQEVVQVKRNHWGLAAWYPNAPRKEGPKAKPENDSGTNGE